MVEHQKLRRRHHMDIGDRRQEVQHDIGVGVTEDVVEARKDARDVGPGDWRRRAAEHHLIAVRIEVILQSVLEVVAEPHLRDGRLDHHLQWDHVDLLQRLLNHPVGAGFGEDHQCVVLLVRYDAHLGELEPVCAGIAQTEVGVR